MASMQRRQSKDSVGSGDASGRRRVNLSAFMPERVNAEISKRYDIDPNEVGAGGYGKVYVASDRFTPTRKVAIKKVPVFDEEKRTAFKKEADIMKTLDHPHICKLLETYDQGRQMFFVMEYCEGREVFDRIMDNGNISESSTAGIARQCAGALKYAHSHGIAHRDMKPENICYVDQTNDDIKVIDWGLGFYFAEARRMSSAVGSLTYAAPEVLESSGNTGYDASTSVDSSGKLPFVTLKRGNDEATIYLLGANVTSYKTDGTEWLGMRKDAVFDGSKPISGGVPICFPQFGPGEVQLHGFARNLPWRLLEEPSEAGICVMELTDSEETRAMWPHAFRCEYRVELQDGRLATTLKVQNTSASDFSFTAGLHTYWDTFDAGNCTISGGFEGKSKIVRVKEPFTRTTATSNDFQVREFTDEMYKEVLPGTVTLKDPAKGDVAIESGGGWGDVCVWNPWGNNDQGYTRFLCIESIQDTPVPLPPNGVWEATMDIVPQKKA